MHPFSLFNFRAMIFYLVLRKTSLEMLKVPHNDHWTFKLFLVKLVHLVKNVHKKETIVFEHKISHSPRRTLLREFRELGFKKKKKTQRFRKQMSTHQKVKAFTKTNTDPK